MGARLALVAGLALAERANIVGWTRQRLQQGEGQKATIRALAGRSTRVPGRLDSR